MTENDSPGRELAAVDDLIARLAFGFPTEEGGIRFADRHDRGRAVLGS